jgi:hypothetical protein
MSQHSLGSGELRSCLSSAAPAKPSARAGVGEAATVGADAETPQTPFLIPADCKPGDPQAPNGAMQSGASAKVTEIKALHAAAWPGLLATIAASTFGSRTRKDRACSK